MWDHRSEPADEEGIPRPVLDLCWVALCISPPYSSESTRHGCWVEGPRQYSVHRVSAFLTSICP
jgi:hypothetical protein